MCTDQNNAKNAIHCRYIGMWSQVWIVMLGYLWSAHQATPPGFCTKPSCLKRSLKKNFLYDNYIYTKPIMRYVFVCIFFCEIWRDSLNSFNVYLIINTITIIKRHNYWQANYLACLLVWFSTFIMNDLSSGEHFRRPAFGIQTWDSVIIASNSRSVGWIQSAVHYLLIVKAVKPWTELRSFCRNGDTIKCTPHTVHYENRCARAFDSKIMWMCKMNCVWVLLQTPYLHHILGHAVLVEMIVFQTRKAFPFTRSAGSQKLIKGFKARPGSESLSFILANLGLFFRSLKGADKNHISTVSLRRDLSDGHIFAESLSVVHGNRGEHSGNLANIPTLCTLHVSIRNTTWTWT